MAVTHILVCLGYFRGTAKTPPAMNARPTQNEYHGESKMAWI